MFSSVLLMYPAGFRLKVLMSWVGNLRIEVRLCGIHVLWNGLVRQFFQWVDGKYSIKYLKNTYTDILFSSSATKCDKLGFWRWPNNQ